MEIGFNPFFLKESNSNNSYKKNQQTLHGKKKQHFFITEKNVLFSKEKPEEKCMGLA
jgi:hypothetical protein